MNYESGSIKNKRGKKEEGKLFDPSPCIPHLS